MKHLTAWERWGVLGLVLLAWGLRWIALHAVPPGWRDDDLIELYTFSAEIVRSGPVLYFSGASGHEPLFHTLRALTVWGAGVNVATARWLPAVSGTLITLLTWAIGRRMFTRTVGLTAAACVTLSFWSLMYSRFALRQIGTPVFVLVALYWGWRLLRDATPPRGAVWGIALGTGGAILTYYAGRLTPAMLLATLLFAAPRPGRWRPFLLGVGGGLLLAAPMFWAAAQLPGADARVSELAAPLNALLALDLGTFWGYARESLGMFHITGDPEWLYNILSRPVFGVLGAAFFFVGLLTRLGHLNKPESRLLLIWLAAGLSPAFLSIPPSSLGHTIVALPLTYLLATMPIKAAARRWPRTALPLALALIAAVGVRDLPDYFIRWPQAPMVRFLYRADYRELAAHLDAHPDIVDAGAASFLFGVWDQLALETDLHREDVAVRWFNPERAIVGTDAPLLVYLPPEVRPKSHPHLAALIAPAPLADARGGLMGRWLTFPPPPAEAQRFTDTVFGDALALQAVQWETLPAPGVEGWLATWWQVSASLPLPPEELLPNPPPPGVYNGPRLKVYVHLLGADGVYLTGDDGLWVDPYRLQVGDRILQWQRLALPTDAPNGPYTVRIGLYDPLTGERWRTAPGEDGVTVAVED